MSARRSASAETVGRGRLKFACRADPLAEFFPFADEYAWGRTAAHAPIRERGTETFTHVTDAPPERPAAGRPPEPQRRVHPPGRRPRPGASPERRRCRRRRGQRTRLP